VRGSRTSPRIDSPLGHQENNMSVYTVPVTSIEECPFRVEAPGGCNTVYNCSLSGLIPGVYTLCDRKNTLTFPMKCPLREGVQVFAT